MGGAEVLLIVVALQFVLALAATEPAVASSPDNVWAEPTRGLLALHCGRCHIPNLPTSLPRALAVFDLTEEPWYGRLNHEQLDSVLLRVRSIPGLPEIDQSIVERFVLCAVNGKCSPDTPLRPGSQNEK